MRPLAARGMLPCERAWSTCSLLKSRPRSVVALFRDATHRRSTGRLLLIAAVNSMCREGQRSIPASACYLVLGQALLAPVCLIHSGTECGVRAASDSRIWGSKMGCRITVPARLSFRSQGGREIQLTREGSDIRD
jgi:hypothetical protein